MTHPLISVYQAGYLTKSQEFVSSRRLPWKKLGSKNRDLVSPPPKQKGTTNTTTKTGRNVVCLCICYGYESLRIVYTFFINLFYCNSGNSNSLCFSLWECVAIPRKNNFPNLMKGIGCGGWREVATNKHLPSSATIHGTANPGSEQQISFGGRNPKAMLGRK